MQSQFSKALLDPKAPTPDGVINPDRRLATKRFDVYRNNVTVSLVNALGDGFPVAKKIVGPKFFDALALEYVRDNLPQSPLMMLYGDTFPAFLAEFPPAQQVPYLADVAQLEWARRVAYHAADDPMADLAPLSKMDESALMQCRFAFHAAVQILSSPHPILAIWHYNQDTTNVPIPPNGQSVLVSRPDDQVLMAEIPAAGRVFFAAMIDGATLGDASQTALQSAPDFDLSQNLTHLFGAGALSALIT